MSANKGFYVAGLDLGQTQDYSALGIIQARPTAHNVEYLGTKFGRFANLETTIYGPPVRLDLVHLERWPLRTTYPAIVGDTIKRMGKAPGKAELVVDQTGVGRGVVDLFRAQRQELTAMTITAGGVVSVDTSAGGLDLRVPKRELVHKLLIALQEERLRWARSLKLGKALVDELTSFQMKVSAGGHDSYEAERQDAHDDIVLAVAMAAWFADALIGEAYDDQLERIAELEAAAASPPPRISTH